ncbi:MAG: TerC/Alx family metal homeostasis membrane protein [Patescibacteria group bacterium]
MEPNSTLFAIFCIVVVGFLVADLGYFNRKAHKISLSSAVIQTVFWIAVSLIFAALIFFWIDQKTATEFLTAYVTEKMLSVDNLFVILLIFNFFRISERYYHRVLFWGIMGAIVFRGIFIGAGAILVSNFHWILYIFGAILIYTGIKLLFDKKEEHADFSDHGVLRFAKKFFSFTTDDHGGKFFVRKQGKIHATLLFMVILLVEATDIVFAVDSIPAAFAISQDPFVVFTSNIFAIMGLRALFFVIEKVVHRFHHLQKGLSFILVFIGVKMLAGIFDIHLSSMISFAIIMSALAISLIMSILLPKKI